MASLYPKKISGRTYWYLREMGRVDGVPRMISERYLGTAEDITAAVDGATVEPDRTRHLAFGAVAAVWGMLARLDVAGIVDEVITGQPPGLPLSVGTYIALATVNRVVEPRSKLGFASWWATTAADRFTRIGTRALDHRRFWDAMRAITIEELERVEARVAARVIDEFDLDTSSVALDMTNFSTYIHSANGKAPIAQRGKAKQKRADLRLVGLGLIVTRDGGIPLLSHAYPGNKPDVTQFPTMIDALCARHAALAAGPAAAPASQVTVVFDAGQNSVANFAHLAETGLHYIGSVPASDCPDLLTLPRRRLSVVDENRFGGLSACDTRRRIYGQDRRAILTHSPELHAAQARSFADTTLAKACKALDELAATLARGKTRRERPQVEAEIEKITANTWVRRVIAWHLAGDTPAEHRLTWHTDTTAQAALEAEIFGKHVLITDHDDWPVADVVAGYRSQSEAEFSFRQLKDPHIVSFSPMHHFTDHNIRVHTQTCVLALQIAHLMRRMADQAGLHLSVRELIDQLAGIQETVLIYPSTGGRPKARRKITDTTPTQDHLAEIFQLQRYTPRT